MILLRSVAREDAGRGCASPSVRSLGACQLGADLTARSIVMLISVCVLGTTEGLPGRRSLVEGHSKLGHIGRKLGHRPEDPTTRDCCFSEAHRLTRA